MSAVHVRIGTSSWSSPDWKGSFYPADARPADFLALYAARYDTVECDSTFYGIPRPRTVDGWHARTSDGFVFSSKLPREITHERGLTDCRETLAAFLELWPRQTQLVVEVRNARWIAPPLLDLLREHRVGLVLPAIYTMPGPARLFAGPDPVTTDLVYVRFLGDHRKMDRLVGELRESGRRRADWSELALDRVEEMRQWVAPLRRVAAAGSCVRVYFNNHYAGFAPGSADQFRRIWDED